MLNLDRTIGVQPLLSKGAEVNVRLKKSFYEAAPEESSWLGTGLLDTGAVATAVPLEVANKLDLTAVGSATINSATQKKVLCPVYIVALEVDGHLISNAHPVVALDVDRVLLGRWFLRTGDLGYAGDKGEFVLRVAAESEWHGISYPFWVK